MTRLESYFVTEDDLIIVQALVSGPRGSVNGRFVLDTGAAATTLIPELADAIGYGASDGIMRTNVRSALGEEHGYLLKVAEFSSLKITERPFVVQVFDLDFDDIDGLLGMNFLSKLNCDIRCEEQRVLVERSRQAS